MGHDVVEQSGSLTGVVQREDVRVTQPGGDPDLAQEPLGTDRGGEIGGEHLDRYSASVLPIDRQVDRAHPATPELTLDRVSAPEGRGETGERVRQRWPSLWGDGPKM